MSQDEASDLLSLLSDERDLNRLINKYQAYADTLDVKKQMDECYIEDATFSSPPTGEIKGRDNIEIHVMKVVGLFKTLHHIISNRQFDIQGNSATGHGSLSFVSVYNQDGQTQYRDGRGHYDWTFVKTPLGWRIERCDVTYTWQGKLMPADD